MRLKLVTTLATGVAGALAGLILGYLTAGPGSWLGPMPEVVAIIVGTIFAVLGVAVGLVLSLLSNHLVYFRDYILAGVVSCLALNLVLSLGTGGPTDGGAFLQTAFMGACFGIVYKYALLKFSKLN